MLILEQMNKQYTLLLLLLLLTNLFSVSNGQNPAHAFHHID